MIHIVLKLSGGTLDEVLLATTGEALARECYERHRDAFVRRVLDAEDINAWLAAGADMEAIYKDLLSSAQDEVVWTETSLVLEAA